MVQETGVQYQVMSYERSKKWYFMLPCLTLSTIRYVSIVKWSNPGNGVVPSTTPRCSSFWKGSPRVTLDSGCQLYLLTYCYAILCSSFWKGSLWVNLDSSWQLYLLTYCDAILCSSFWKGSLWVTLNSGWQLYLLTYCYAILCLKLSLLMPPLLWIVIT